MLVVVTGAGGAGKSTAYRTAGPLLDAPSAEFDQIGVSPGADTAWRQRAIETWIQTALAEPGADNPRHRPEVIKERAGNGCAGSVGLAG